MARIGAFCLPESGHLTPTLALMLALAARGHEIVVFTVPDTSATVRRAGLRPHQIGARFYPAGTLARRRAAMGPRHGVAAAAVSGHYTGRYMEAVMADGLAALATEPLDALVIDQTDIAAHAVAHRAGIPFITIALCLIMNADRWHPIWAIEPAPDPPRLTPANEQWRNIFNHLFAPQLARLNRFRGSGAHPLHDVAELWSPLAQISQQPPGFEFLREPPPTLHFAGPFVHASLRESCHFPWERLTGQPLIYAAFGSEVNGNAERIRAIAAACEQFDVQLVLQLDGADAVRSGLPDTAVVVPFAPQVELLKRACLMVTHAGLNSTLECLTAGVPMVALPVTTDAPGVAARIAWSSTGVAVPEGTRNPTQLRAAITEVMTNERYRRGAAAYRDRIAARDGATYAAGLIEQAAGIGGA